MTPLTIILTLIMLLLAAGLGAFFAVLRRPPVIHVDLGDVRVDVAGTLDATQMIPSTLTVRVAPVPPTAPGWESQEAPMSPEVFEYTDAESDDWARTARRTRARTLFNELADWKLVLATLKREDGVVDETPKTE